MYGGVAYGQSPYAASGSAEIVRFTSDGFSISDSVSRTISFPRATSDSWSISDSSRGSFRTTDSWSISDAARLIFAPYVDLPSHLALKEGGGVLAIEAGDQLFLDPAVFTLKLQSGDDCTLKDEPRGLALRDEPRRVWVDG